MAAPTKCSRSSFFHSFQALRLCFQCRQRLIFVLTIVLFMIHCISGHTVNENLFMEVLYPDDISYTYKIRPARTFGGVFNDMMNSVHLVPADPDDGCGELYNAAMMLNNVAFVKRGHCSFLSKAVIAERAGAVAVVIYDNDEKNDWSWIDMIGDGSERDATIPAVFLLGRDGIAMAEACGDFFDSLWNRIKKLIVCTNAFGKGCWKWGGGCTNGRYGKIKITYGGLSLSTTAHRAAFIAYHRQLHPDGEISHRCHEQLCVNPEHLSNEPRHINLRRNLCRDVKKCRGHGGFQNCIF